MARREYTAGSPTTLASAFNTGNTSFIITSATNWPTSSDYDFFVTIDGGTAQEERVLCSARTGTTVTVATGGRGKDGTGEKNHAQGATIWPSWSAQDADESNAHIESTGYASYSKSVHGLGSGDGDVVGTGKTQTLTNKTISLSNNTVTGTTAQFNAALTDTDFATTVSVASEISTAIPAGSITMFAGSAAPTGWLLCQGSAVSRTTYASLFSAIGTTYGVGDGSTTFNLPDLRGRAPIGVGTGTGLTARALAATTGIESVTLTAAQSGLPAHSHGISDPGHAHIQKGREVAATGGGAPALIDPSFATGATTTGSATTGITVNNNTAANAASAHDNMQPSLALNFIIRH